ncbi:MAG: M23 family metallopeptidase [Xanthomonadaceae bacterium]|nr:M23 family metallopeptidase [Xanthomonadaceae bacterium]
MMDQKHWLLLSKLITVAGIVISMGAAHSPASKVILQGKLLRSEMIDGTLNRAEITGPKGLKLKARFGDTEFAVVETGVSGEEATYESVFAVAFDTPPGEKNFEILWKENDAERTFSIPFVLKSGKYPFEKLSVDPSKVTPPKSALPRIAREQEEINKVYKSSEANRIWKDPLVLPMRSEITSSYGTRRVYNGAMKSYHAGTDFRAPVGTPIFAPTQGKVALAKDLYFSGGTILLDHGNGFFTQYFHMSKFSVKVGDIVKPGDMLGLSGASGRVSGPHLHWGVLIHRIKVNALDAMEVLR